MTRKNRQLRPKNATSEAGLQATGHKRADHFRETQKVAIIHHKFGVHLGNPGLFLSIFGAACAVTIIEAVRRSR